MTEIETERELQTKGADAPRLTPDMIDKKIDTVDYHVFPDTTLTVCKITLENGFAVVGQSAAASPENFDAEIGRRLAFKDARRQIWPLEGYLLRQRMAFPFSM